MYQVFLSISQVFLPLDNAIQMEENDNILRVSHYSTNKYSDKISYILFKVF